MVAMNRFRLLAVSSLAIAGWSLAAAQPDAAKGKDVFQQQCAVCHNTASDQKKMGPGLKALLRKDKMANGKKPTEANVRAKIDEGGNGMPAYKDMLDARQKDDVLAYLKTL
jgi:mono/diheme cytochrome c family protein